VRTRVATIVCGALAIAASAAFAEALRRYAVGVKGPIDYLGGSWQPPFGATTLTIAAFVLSALTAVFVRYLVGTEPIPEDRGPPRKADQEPSSGLEGSRPEGGKHVRDTRARRPERVRQGNYLPELGL
jgi:hypothetical protein